MLMEVAEFCRRVDAELGALIEDLQDHTGREGDDERYAWTSSLPRLAEALSAPSLQQLHLYFERRGKLELEYRLPASGAWCDAVLLGQGPQGPAVVIIELKHWITGEDRPGPTEPLVYHLGNLVSHPSVQVGSYVEYCRRFHSAVQSHSSSVSGCVLFTRSTGLDAYLQPPHDALVKNYPLFGAGINDLRQRFPEWVFERIREPNEKFADDFSNGVYTQDRRFVRHVSSLMTDPQSSPFVLLDQQRRAYDLIMHEMEKHLGGADRPERLVVLVDGPPGSGKSVLAAQLWARLALHPEVDGNVVLCTTSGSQRSNWEHLFSDVSKSSAGAGLVVPANAFNPGLQPKWIKDCRSKGMEMAVSDWRANLEAFRESGKTWRSPDSHFAATIVDEAHALIDPTAPNAEGTPPSGWCVHAGPQAWHIIRSSKISMFLMDAEQSYRDNETTTPASIERFAQEFAGTRVIRVSLEGAQFRCGGSKEFTDWVEGVLAPVRPVPASTSWRRTPQNLSGKFEFELVDSPRLLEDALRARHVQGASVRLVASYAREWLTKAEASPHGLPDDRKDFYFELAREGRTERWAKIWNYAPGQDYTYFVQGRQGTPIGNDPLCEVGCPYVVRGFDFDYVGLLWLPDLIWRGGGWQVDLSQVHETAWPKTKAAAKRAKTDPAPMANLLQRVRRGYRILLTRAIKGVYVWCSDPETRDHLGTLFR